MTSPSSILHLNLVWDRPSQRQGTPEIATLSCALGSLILTPTPFTVLSTAGLPEPWISWTPVPHCFCDPGNPSGKDIWHKGPLASNSQQTFWHNQHKNIFLLLDALKAAHPCLFMPKNVSRWIFRICRACWWSAYGNYSEHPSHLHPSPQPAIPAFSSMPISACFQTQAAKTQWELRIVLAF